MCIWKDGIVLLLLLLFCITVKAIDHIIIFVVLFSVVQTLVVNAIVRGSLVYLVRTINKQLLLNVFNEVLKIIKSK